MDCTIDGLQFVSNFDSGNLAQAEKAVKVDEDGVKQPSPVASGFQYRVISWLILWDALYFQSTHQDHL